MIHPRVSEYIADEYGPSVLAQQPDEVRGIFVEDGEGPLGDIQELSELFRIRMGHWSNMDLSVLPKIPKLDSVEFWDCDIHDISILAECKKLEYVNFRCCLVEDITPLMGLTALYQVSFEGCPLTPESYQEQRSLRKRGVGGRFACPEREWRINRKLWEHGVRCSVFLGEGYNDTRISVPGLEGKAFGTIVLTEDDVDRILAEHRDLDTARFMALGRAQFRANLKAKREAAKGPT